MRSQGKKTFCWHSDWEFHTDVYIYSIFNWSSFHFFHPLICSKVAASQADTTKPTCLAHGACASCSGLLMFPMQNSHCCTAWPLLSCRNHWLHCSEITTPEWPHVHLTSAFLPPSACLAGSLTMWCELVCLEGPICIQCCPPAFLKHLCKLSHPHPRRLKFENGFGVSQCTVM